MDKAWQLCIVDRESCDFSKAPEFERVFKTASNLESIKNGTVLFAITSILKPFNSLNPRFYELKDSPKFSFIGGVMFSYAWLPSTKQYGLFMQDILRPILSEQDVIYAETQFGVNLENFI